MNGTVTILIGGGGGESKQLASGFDQTSIQELKSFYFEITLPPCNRVIVSHLQSSRLAVVEAA